jgi:hypothetical protein
MIECPLPLRVVEREAIVPGIGDDENNAADLPVTNQQMSSLPAPTEVFQALGHPRDTTTPQIAPGAPFAF